MPGPGKRSGDTDDPSDHEANNPAADERADAGVFVQYAAENDADRGAAHGERLRIAATSWTIDRNIADVCPRHVAPTAAAVQH